MVLSDYLETIVDFDEPILVVGPGLDLVQVGKEFIHMPMDRALIWFAEKIRGRKGRVDVFDIPPEKQIDGCYHGIDRVKEYMENLAKQVGLGEIRYLIGDVADYPFSAGEYGTIWDHATTIDLWVSWQVYKEEGVAGERIKERMDQVISNYERALRETGTIVLTGEYSFHRRLPEEGHKRNSEMGDGEDKYRTTLRPPDLFLGSAATSEHVWKEGFLIPRYKSHVMTELTKKRG